MKRVMRLLVGPLVIVLVAVGSFMGGVVYTDLGGTVPSVGTLVGSQATQLGGLVDQVNAIIEAQALKPSPESSITAGAIRGMLASLDDTYAAYYDPSEYAALQQDQAGQFYGIGVSMSLNASGQPIAVTVYPNTPASRAGIKQGDVFIGVNGVIKTKWDLDTFVTLVRGPLGTKVTLEFVRGGKTMSVTLAREQISVPVTITKQYGDVGYVRLLTFNDRSASNLATAIKAFDAKGCKGYVLDLRENLGGLLDAAVGVTSLFVRQGVVVRVDARGVPEQLYSVNGGQITTKPLVVLVDALSASASEIVTGALKDYGRATIVGVQTYGKGSVQNVNPVRNGGAVKMTIAHYLTPLRNVINGIGVTPDVVVKMDPNLQMDPAKDAQLQQALTTLRSKL
jgi:carboxyl-terminal processing protease